MVNGATKAGWNECGNVVSMSKQMRKEVGEKFSWSVHRSGIRKRSSGKRSDDGKLGIESEG